ncbi:hypothetical protein CBS147311_7905 [Penicillium roqueforti]|nr:hypothetical protein CBS147311_7905 [Penicillium roqueforti]KAI3289478.1 hypothetical protein DTO002I6_6794 [Penicillium roqueforti]
MDNWWHQTLDSHRGAHTPFPPNYALDEKWKWKHWKFGYEDPNVLFTTLHAEYNTLHCALQDPYAWHKDVTDVTRIAENRDQFLTLLKKRQKERFDELQEAWETTKEVLTAEPSRVDQWAAFLNIARHMSYDSLVAYFGFYATDNQPSTSPLPSTPNETNPANPPQPKGKAKKKMATSSGVTKSSSRASKSKPKRNSSSQGGVRRSARLQQRTEQANR